MRENIIAITVVGLFWLGIQAFAKFVEFKKTGKICIFKKEIFKRKDLK